MKKRKQEMMQELEDIKKKHAKKSESAGTEFSLCKYSSHLEELRERFISGVKSIPEGNKEAAAYQLQGLIQVSFISLGV